MMDLKDVRKRIINRIDISDSGCWDWTLKIRPNGYARTTYKKVSWYAHRLSYAAFKGEIPEGLDVCHSCDNRKCVNPEHLFAGTRKENMQDAVSKGRQAKGEDLPQSKLSNDERWQVLEMIRAGFKYKAIAKLFNVTRYAINHIAIANGIRIKK